MAVGIFTSMANDELVKAIASLQSDIAVLREENAQLRVARHRHGEEPLTELRGLGAEVASATGAATATAASEGAAATADTVDAQWQAMTDVLVMRDVLLEMCAQVQNLTTRLQARLERLVPPRRTVAADDLHDAVGPTS